jgi:NAD(P)-dependent dehydrogenase (short-subunit alcohol dehydrogenase family)
MAERVVWIVGASSGIGRALALRMARDGWRVAASARSVEALEALAQDSQGRISAHLLDVTDEAAVAGVAATVWRDVGAIDLAVFAAGRHIPVDAAAFEVEPFRQLVEINFMGVVYGLAGVVPRMVERGVGHIAVVSSIAGYRGLPTASAYGATKGALNNMTEALKFDLEPKGIKVQLVCPGFVRTPMTDKNPFPMPFLMEPEDAAEAFYRGLQGSVFEINFPRRFTFMMNLLCALPHRLYMAVTRWGTGT